MLVTVITIFISILTFATYMFNFAAKLHMSLLTLISTVLSLLFSFIYSTVLKNLETKDLQTEDEINKNKILLDVLFYIFISFSIISTISFLKDVIYWKDENMEPRLR